MPRVWKARKEGGRVLHGFSFLMADSNATRLLQFMQREFPKELIEIENARKVVGRYGISGKLQVSGSLAGLAANFAWRDCGAVARACPSTSSVMASGRG